MNIFGSWKDTDVAAHNARVAAKRLGAGGQPITDSHTECTSRPGCQPRPARPSISTDEAKLNKTKLNGYNRAVVYAFFKSQNLPPPLWEYRFYESRKWRFDLAWPEFKVALEVQGGIFSHGRHTRGAALLKEWEKLNNAACLGWRILYCQPNDLCLVSTATMIHSALFHR